jgi:hypothetical protein
MAAIVGRLQSIIKRPRHVPEDNYDWNQLSSPTGITPVGMSSSMPLSGAESVQFQTIDNGSKITYTAQLPMSALSTLDVKYNATHLYIYWVERDGNIITKQKRKFKLIPGAKTKAIDARFSKQAVLQVVVPRKRRYVASY